MELNNLKQTYDLVIFDVDGVILNSFYHPSGPCYFNFVKKVCTDIGVSFPFETKKDLQERYIEPHPNFFNSIGVDWETHRDLLTQMHEDYFLTRKLPLVEGITEAIQELVKKQKRLAIITGNYQEYINFQVPRNVLNAFEIVITSSQMKEHGLNPKPSPDSLLFVIKEIGSASALYIGDQSTDVQTAKAARVDSLAYSDGWDTYKNLKSSDPTSLVTTSSSLCQILAQL